MASTEAAERLARKKAEGCLKSAGKHRPIARAVRRGILRTSADHENGNFGTRKPEFVSICVVVRVAHAV
jgi:hypothetical protein